MRRYIIIAIAIMAAILVMSLVKMIQARRAKARGEIPHKTAGIDISHIIGALVGLAVFSSVLCFLKAEHRPPGLLMSRRH